MNNLNHYKTILEEQLKNIVAELKTIGIYNEEKDDWSAIPDPEEAGSDPDNNTTADVVEDWNERRATLSSLEREYRDIKRALNKIDAGTFGTCEISGEQIEEKRLEARPEARTSMAHMDEESSLPL